ncbi:unnamed protein product [Bathycoccus prasinos]
MMNSVSFAEEGEGGIDLDGRGMDDAKDEGEAGEDEECEEMAATSSFRAFLNHPAGPKTIFFWAPTMKWAITIANVKDFQRPPELLSVPQQSAVALTGLIWMKYSLDITPKNYNLMAVNAAMAVTGLYQLYRRYEYDREMKKIMEQSEGGGGGGGEQT